MDQAQLVPARMALWAVLAGLGLYTIGVPLVGHLVCDGRARNVWVFLAYTAVIAIVILPLMMLLESGHALALWLIVPALIGSTAIPGGIMTSVGPQIYTPATRTTGYNLSHNL